MSVYILKSSQLCQKCQHPISDDDKFCPNCGAEKKKEAETDAKKEDLVCQHCNQPVKPDNHFCPHCGKEIKATDGAMRSVLYLILAVVGLLLLTGL